MTKKWIQFTFVALSLGFGILFGWQGVLKQESYLPLLGYPLLFVATSFLVISIGDLFKKSSLRALNVVTLGLFFGFLLARALLLLIGAVGSFVDFSWDKETLTLLKTVLFLFCGYLGMVLTWQASDEWAVSIPFLRFRTQESKPREFLLDPRALLDPRIIDLAATGLLDQRLLLSRDTLETLQKHAEEKGEEAGKAKRSLENLKKLESISSLELRIVEEETGTIQEGTTRLLQIAKWLGADLLTSDPGGIRSGKEEGVRWINLQSIAKAFQSLHHQGESLEVEIQRVGKEKTQGIGYLEDGTMVIVNGGASHLGQAVPVHVLSVNHTSNGRMVFCNLKGERT